MAQEQVVEIAARAGKYLTFRLGAEEFGLAILKVQEIIGLLRITRVPRTPAYIRGVINLRGKVIPVVDLRLRFAMEGKADTDRTCVIVVEIVNHGTRITTGILVDDVCEVLNIAPEQLEPPPSFGSEAATEFLIGMGKVAQRVVMLLDIDRALGAAEIDALEQVQQKA